MTTQSIPYLAETRARVVTHRSLCPPYDVRDGHLLNSCNEHRRDRHIDEHRSDADGQHGPSVPNVELVEERYANRENRQNDDCDHLNPIDDRLLLRGQTVRRGAIVCRKSVAGHMTILSAADSRSRADRPESFADHRRSSHHHRCPNAPSIAGYVVAGGAGCGLRSVWIGVLGLLGVCVRGS